MSDREEILSLLNRYCMLVDTGDLKAFADLFSAGAWYVEGAEPNRGSKEIFNNVCSQIILYEDGTPRTRHLNANIEISINDSAASARCERYVTILQHTDSLPLQVIASGQYQDDFVKEGGNWRFARTLVKRPFLGNMSQHMKSQDVIEG